MKLRDASSSARSILFGRPATVLPFFLAGSSINLIAQTFPILGLVLCYLLLAGTGRLDTVVTALRHTDLANAGTNPEGANRLADALQGLLTPEVILILVVSMLLALVAVFVARAVVGAAQVHAVTAALRNERPVPAGVVGAGEDATRFLLLSLARLAAFVVVSVAFGVAFLAFVFLSVLAQADSTAVTLLGGLVLFLVFLVVSLVVYLLFMFVPQAIVIDDVGIWTGIRRSGGFVRHNVARTAAYIIIAVGLFGVFAFVTAGFGLVGVSRVSGIILLFFLLPALSVLKTAVYLDAEPTLSTGRGSLRGAFARGLHELRSFLARKPLLFLVTLGLFALGGVGGWFAAQPFTLRSVRPDLTTNVFGTIPVDVFVKIAANNWLVAISAAFAGIGFGVPTLVTVLFNGAVVGAVVGLLPNPTLALALILPHGVIEIPGLSVAGALGLHLGGVSWSYVRGRTSVEEFSDELVRAYYVVLGLLPVFIVAAFIEAFVTWWVAARIV
ncbi:flagellar biosynthesis protein [Haladaptatus sp. R4]|uniref:stage II sporulation protein M n=1 Tax=Haladaptatus sp. R4 TaxID=1679489 RepID=UPI0007B486EB|nr:stage II sporulation protein M [Haladaptatus sp. R4]KZN22475.1 flagellar biosynthesis protein [Haladaptatus sp. R4]